MVLILFFLKRLTLSVTSFKFPPPVLIATIFFSTSKRSTLGYLDNLLAKVLICFVTKINILVYSLLLAPIVALPFFFNFGSLVYLTFSSLMTIYYIYLCVLLFKEKDNKTSNIIARKVFVYSIFYLFFIFVLILADNMIQY